MTSVEIEVKGGEEEESEKEYGKWDKWEIESAARTIIEAESIKADKEKMKYVAECMKKQADGMKKAISSLDELKAVAKKKSMESDY